MFHRTAPILLALGLALGLTSLVAAPAHAIFPCNGPGPGQIMVGMDNSTNPPTPICDYDPNYVDPGPSGYWVERFGAIAWGFDASGYATYAWYINAASFAEAETGALNACVSSGFQNCHLGPTVANGSLAVAVGKDGTLYAEFGADNGEAKRKAMRLCKKSSKGCKVEEVLASPAAWVSY
jgi:Domain of unknown function (DUF4189)